jgi:hypothetical protein
VTPETVYDPDLPIYPAPGIAKRIPPSFRATCHQAMRKPDVLTCTFGAVTDFTKTIALVGGSHSLHWLPAFEALADGYRWKIVSITKSACPFEASAARKPSCIQWNEDVIPVLRALKPDVVVTTSTRTDLRSDSNADGQDARRNGRVEIVPKGYLRQWQRLAESGLSVIALRDSPRMGFDVPECVERSMPDLSKCARPRAGMLAAADPTARLDPKPDNVTFIDLTDRYCDATTCFPVNGNVLIYRDKHHMSATYARSLAAVLGERMRRARPDLFEETPQSGKQAMVR